MNLDKEKIDGNERSARKPSEHVYAIIRENAGGVFILNHYPTAAYRDRD